MGANSWIPDEANDTLLFSRKCTQIRNSKKELTKCPACKVCHVFRINNINKNLFKCIKCNSLIETGQE